MGKGKPTPKKQGYVTRAAAAASAQSESVPINELIDSPPAAKQQWPRSPVAGPSAVFARPSASF